MRLHSSLCPYSPECVEGESRPPPAASVMLPSPFRPEVCASRKARGLVSHGPLLRFFRESDELPSGSRPGSKVSFKAGEAYSTRLPACRTSLPKVRKNQREGSTRERGPYWYFQFHEGGKRRKLYLGKTSDPQSTLAAKRSKPLGE
jgi:hypothetical protein